MCADCARDKNQKDDEEDMAKKDTAVSINKENLSDAIVKVSDGLKALQASGLLDRTIILLLQDHTGLSMKTIKLVLDALPKLKEAYCK
jgi:hypothetical protein